MLDSNKNSYLKHPRSSHFHKISQTFPDESIHPYNKLKGYLESLCIVCIESFLRVFRSSSQQYWPVAFPTSWQVSLKRLGCPLECVQGASSPLKMQRVLIFSSLLTSQKILLVVWEMLNSCTAKQDFMLSRYLHCQIWTKTKATFTRTRVFLESEIFRF